MNVDIWNIKSERWIQIHFVNKVYISSDWSYFKLDHTIYKTSEYDISFIMEA